MIVNKTNAMICLLNALNIFNIVIKEDVIEVNINNAQLLYAINSVDEDIEYIYGKTDEWKELTGIAINNL